MFKPHHCQECLGARVSTESRCIWKIYKLLIILVPFISLVAMTIVTLALTSSHFYVLPSFPAKYLSGSSVTDGACTESQTTTFSSGLTYTLTITQAKVWHRCECVVAFFQSVFFFFFSRKLESYIWKCRN